MQYLSKFDSDGVRITSVPIDDDLTPGKRKELEDDGFIEISEEEWNYYIGNKGDGDNGTGYIRDKNTGKPVSAPPYAPTKEEKIAKLDAQYDADKTEIVKYFNDAALANDTELQDELRAEMAEIDAQYIEDRKAIEGSEE